VTLRGSLMRDVGVFLLLFFVDVVVYSHPRLPRSGLRKKARHWGELLAVSARSRALRGRHVGMEGPAEGQGPWRVALVSGDSGRRVGSPATHSATGV